VQKQRGRVVPAEFLEYDAFGRQYVVNESLMPQFPVRVPRSQRLKAVIPQPIRALLGRLLGIIEYISSPDRQARWGPFNGQTARQALFVEIVARTGPEAIVETGTFLGETTELMSQTGLPVFTIELNPRNYGFARARFWRRPNVKLLLGDSRANLRTLFDGPLRAMFGRTLFVYLDAHWNDDLPTAEEVDIVFDRSPRAIVMIDDFEVPFDPGYGYDDYGPGKTLVASYIRPVISAHQLQAFYPSTPSAVDHPSTLSAAAGLAVAGRLRRGCIVLAKKDCHGSVLASLPLLRPAAELVPPLDEEVIRTARW